MTVEFEYYTKNDFSNYTGKEISILGEKIIVSGTDFTKVYESAKVKSGKHEPLFTLIPKINETLIF
ncbi:MAG: DUF5678 domain-containing protein [Candidatus Nitrosoabyssus spongiisocia]|nr:MAG: DUF5678 domain-containing protein [Nitrosopumilaceae archaeon AB1(1)]